MTSPVAARGPGWMGAPEEVFLVEGSRTTSCFRRPSTTGRKETWPHAYLDLMYHAVFALPTKANIQSPVLTTAVSERWTGAEASHHKIGCWSVLFERILSIWTRCSGNCMFKAYGKGKRRAICSRMRDELICYGICAAGPRLHRLGNGPQIVCTVTLHPSPFKLFTYPCKLFT